MNLATKFNPLYWQCACLCVNAGNYAGELGAEEGDGEAVEDSADGVEEKKERKVAPNYAKIAKAISDAQRAGVTIELPNINEAEADFVPDVKNNAIIYSLKAVSAVSDDLFDRIVAGRPYSSIDDFIARIQPTQGQMIGLIKAGCFDSLAGKPRGRIMSEYLQSLAEAQFPLKDRLTSVQLGKALELNMPFDGRQSEIRMYHFKKYVDKNQYDAATKRYILSDPDCLRFFDDSVKGSLNLSKDEYGYLPGGAVFMKASAFKRAYDSAVAGLMADFNSEEGRKRFQKALQNDFVSQMREKHCAGGISKWEFDAMCFYSNGHELRNVPEARYGIKDFESLPEYPPEGDKTLCAVAGTVIGNNNVRHTVSLLTTHGVVDVKFYATQYGNFNQIISSVDPATKKKTVLDQSWFKRGTKIIVNGFRRENMFVAKNMFIDHRPRCVGLIEAVAPDGTMSVRYGRRRKAADGE